MQIMIVGCGKVGMALSRRLNDEGHAITVIDTNAERVRQITQEIDAMGLIGNGSSITLLSEAGIESTDVFIAVTGSDELNLLCCVFAKKAANCHTIARVRNPIYNHEIDFLKKQLGISAIINPELATAREISQILQFPAALQVDTFADGMVQLIKFHLEERLPLCNLSLREISQKYSNDFLICAVERSGEVIIPSGEFVLQANDIITFLGTKEKISALFKQLHLPHRPVKNAMVIGGGKISYYLASDLLAQGMDVHIIEKDLKRCEYLAENLGDATILNGDGTDRALLDEEGISETEAFVALTNLDEENVLLALYAKKHGHAKLVTKINMLEFDDILESLDIGSVLYPKYITCDYIQQYVRALQNKSGSNLRTLYRILDDRVEVLEFDVKTGSAATDIPLAELNLKPNQLICCITRGDEMIIPNGFDSIQVGDTVIVVTMERGLSDLKDIVDK